MNTPVQEIPQDTVPAALARAVAAAPDRVFLDFEGDRYTFAEIDRLSTALAWGLRERGVKTGEPVSTILDNNVDAIVTWLALSKLGAVSAPVNTAFKGEFLRAQLADTGARLVIAEVDYAVRVGAVASGLPQLEQVIVRGEGLDALRLEERGPIEPAPSPDQLSILIYTSGTTGPSKACMVPQNMACHMAWHVVTTRKYRSDDVIWAPLPLFHMNAIGTVVMAGMIAQCTVALASRFSVSKFWPDVARCRATIVNLLGSMATLLADAPDHEATATAREHIRRLNCAPFPAALADKWRERFGIHASGSLAYGMTETGGITGIPAGESTGPANNSGRATADFEVKVVDDNDTVLGPGEVGEIVCRPKRPNIIFSGYWNRPADTVRAWRNLWFHTGDFGRIDAEGYLFFVDRKKDYMRRRGENISTYDLEIIIRQHVAIKDVAVHAVPSPFGEDDVKVTAELANGAAITEEELCRWCIERMPYFAVPLYIEFRTELPRSATGKLLKEQLRQEGKTPATWDRQTIGLRVEPR